MRKYFLITIIVASAISGNSQPYPEVGKPCPDFVLHNIQYYSKKEASLKDFRGKWLLLDFWSKNCGACIASFPRISAMQKLLEDKLQVMMLAPQGKDTDHEMIYSKYKAKENLVMPCAFDSTIFKQFDYGHILPRAVLIDDKGIVQCLTSSLHLEDMQQFLAGKRPDLSKSYRDNEDILSEENRNSQIPYDQNKLFAINNNGVVDTAFLYRSMLTKWQPGINRYLDGNPLGTSLFFTPRSLRLMGANASTLYFRAYFGEDPIYGDHYGYYYNKVILNIPDSSVFNYDYKIGKNIFCYSLDLPRIPVKVTREYLDSTGRRIMKIMQNDLENYFGYSASVELRKFSCWKLKATNDAKERLESTKGNPFINEGKGAYLKVGNQPFESVFRIMRSWFYNNEFIFDETGITGKVDVDLECKDCLLTEIDDLQKALKPYGLYLERSEREMKAIVIRSQKPE